MDKTSVASVRNLVEFYNREVLIFCNLSAYISSSAIVILDYKVALYMAV